MLEKDLKDRTPSLEQMNKPNYNRTRAGKSEDPERALDPKTPPGEASDESVPNSDEGFEVQAGSLREQRTPPYVENLALGTARN
jgi:hypothetical protein